MRRRRKTERMTPEVRRETDGHQAKHGRIEAERMKRVWIGLILAGVLCACSAVPSEGTDAAELLPARVLLISAERGTLRLETDQDGVGMGRTLDEAMEDLRAGAPGTVFFGTVEQVIVTRGAWYAMPQIAATKQLRPSARLYLTPTLPEPETAAEFLHAHPGTCTLQEARAALLYGRAPEVTTLLMTEGGLRLV